MIRKMEKNDIPEIVDFEIKIFGSSLGHEMLEKELKYNEMAHYFVMEKDNKIIGYIGLWIDDIACQIINFFIKEEFRKNGYGTSFLEYIIEYATNKNVEIFSLEVRESNKTAIALYEKFGFKYSHLRKNYYSDGEHACVLIRQ